MIIWQVLSSSLVKSGRRTTSPRISIVSSRPRLSTLEAYRKVSLNTEIINAGDPDPLVRGMDPARLRILPFSHKDVEQTKIMLAK
jgi:hypothetical protein